MKKRVVMRADGGSRIGFGHFVRTCALAGYLSDIFDCRIATRNPENGAPTDYQLRQIAEAGASPLGVSGGELAAFDAAFLAAIEPDDIVVLDNYYYTTDYQRAVRERCRALVCIDDVHDRHFVADVVMTFCPLRRIDFSLEPYTRFYGGMEWSFLRAPFLAPQVRREAPTAGEMPRRMVIAMGGADPFHLTDKMIDLVWRIAPDTDIDVLAGQTVEVSPTHAGTVRVFRQADAATVARLFDEAQAGIFPASTVCVEAIARGLPVIAGHYVDNQLEIYAHGVGAGWFAPLGELRDDAAALEARLRAAFDALPAPPAFDFAAQRAAIRALFEGA